MKKLLTRAEATKFSETSRSADVEAFLQGLAEGSDLVRIESMGRSGEGREMLAAILSDREAFTPEEARRQKKIIVMVQGNIHAGEVEGKEAIQALARDLARGGRGSEILSRCCLVLIPNVNPDGNDRIHPSNRVLDLAHLEGQVNPEGGVGTRYTGEGWNMNRDFIKQEAPESRHLAATFRRWWPHVFVDCHTTDGSIHDGDLTFDTSHSNQEIFRKLLKETSALLESVSRRIRKEHGYKSFWYGNWAQEDDPDSGWQTYPALPRFGSHYRGLLGRIDILLETYSYIGFKRRVSVIRAWLDEILRYCAKNRGKLIRAVEREERRVLDRGSTPDPRLLVGIHYGTARRDEEGKLLFDYPAWALDGDEIAIDAFDRESLAAHVYPGKKRTVWKAPHRRTFVPTAAVTTPAGYLAPPSLLPRLEGHGIQFEVLQQETQFEVESYRVLAIEKTFSPDVAAAVPPVGQAEVPLSQKPPPRRFETVLAVRPERRTAAFPAGTAIVWTAQRAGTLAVYLLEPCSDDGFTRWEFLDGEIALGEFHPVSRII